MALLELPSGVDAMVREVRDRILTFPWVKMIVLYGSYADGTFHGDSDIDLAVFVDDDGHCGLTDYLVLSRVCLSDRYDIQLQVFSVQELADPCGIVQEIAEHGVVVNHL